MRKEGFLWALCQNRRGCSITMPAAAHGCDIEVLDCLTPKYDVERFGIINTGDPFQADILLITGGVNSQTEPVVKQLYSQMPDPKVVVAVGICACTGGVFKECYNIKGGIDTVIPVDVYVPGCAARPESIIDGVIQALNILDEKRAAFKEQGQGKIGGIMDYSSEIRPVSMDEFLAQVITMKMEGWRLAQICAVRVDDGYEMSYSFCKN